MTQAYKILTADTINELTRVVNDYLDEGWKIIGGVAVCRAHGSVATFYQTVYMDRR